MEKFKQLVLEANKYFKNADHMLYMTYPIVKELRLLISIADNLDKSMKIAIDAVLRYEWIYKRIMRIPEDTRQKIELFERIGIRHGFSKDDISFVIELDDIIRKHKQSPLEFIKDNRLVISYNNYKLKTLDSDAMKSYVSKAKTFILKLNNLLKNDPLIASGR
jgi:hypothetical protein